MTTSPSPAHPFGFEPFSVSQGRAAGLGRGALAGGSYDKPFHGVRQRALPGDDPTRKPSDRDLLKRMCQQYAVRLRPGQFFSHETALVLRGAPAPDGWTPVVHVSVYRPASPPRTKGVVGHRLGLRTPARTSAFGLPLEHPARAWVQTGALWDADDLVAAADYLVARRRRLATIEELRAEVAFLGRQSLAGVVDLVRVGSESPRETRLRLVLVRAGLPEPQLNVDVVAADGRFIARVDLAYPALRIAIEYDGRGHAESAEQFARDADRWDDLRDNGWHLVRILSHHLDGDGGAAVGKVRAALQRAGATH
ncbi:hypothetical protein MRBLWH7_001661 [Microbacterium sp. LWH7-1.2]|uniref:endonuclease domain-containing protein n=1 Tax=Microbacterium sp. LWH7-1.2 TaxID=3135257 RepID=UPI003139A264